MKIKAYMRIESSFSTFFTLGIFYEQHHREDKEIMAETLKKNEDPESKEPREEL